MPFESELYLSLYNNSFALISTNVGNQLVFFPSYRANILIDKDQARSYPTGKVSSCLLLRLKQRATNQEY